MTPFDRRDIASTLFALGVLLAVILLVDAAFSQTNMGPIRTPQLNTNLYVGQSGYATIQSAVTFACRTGNQRFAVVILAGKTPADSPTSVTGGCAGTYIADLRATPLLYYRWTGTAYALTPAFSGIAHTTNLLVGDNSGNASDSGLAPSSVATWPASGIPVSTGSAWGTSINPADVPRLSAPLNNFTGAVHMASGQVDNSPICTESTGCGGGGGATYPPAGIGVSTGSAWSDTSINPTTLATWPTAGVPVSTGSGWQYSFTLPATTNLLAGTAAPAGIANSGIAPSDVARLSAASTTFAGSLHFANATRLTAGTDLNTLNSCGDFDGFNMVNIPQQLSASQTVGVHVWCTGDVTYSVQLAWNMTQYGQPTEIFARNNRGGIWTAWTSFIFDDGAGNVRIPGTLHAGAVAMDELINSPAMQTVSGIGCSITGLGDACTVEIFMAVPQPDMNYFPICSTSGSGLIPMNYSITSPLSFTLQLGGFAAGGGGLIACLVLRSGGFATILPAPIAATKPSPSAPASTTPPRPTKCIQGSMWVKGNYIEACTDAKGTIRHVHLTALP